MGRNRSTGRAATAWQQTWITMHDKQLFRGFAGRRRKGRRRRRRRRRRRQGAQRSSERRQIPDTGNVKTFRRFQFCCDCGRGAAVVLTVEVSKAVLFRLQLNWLYMNRN